MDWMNSRKRLQELFDKYKFVLLIVGVGIILMSIPAKERSDPVVSDIAEIPSEESIEEQLMQILSQIRGVGKVRVMITEQTGAETVYQVDEDRTEGTESVSIRRETVVLSGSGQHTGLVQTVTPPTYLGAVIVCEGAGSPGIRLAVAEAVSAVTGISTDRISVLEMK